MRKFMAFHWPIPGQGRDLPLQGLRAPSSGLLILMLLFINFFTWVRFSVDSTYEPIKSNKLCASKIQWWDRHRIDIPTSKRRNKGIALRSSG